MNKKLPDTNNIHDDKPGLSRREALQKMSYAAFASSTMLLLLNNPTRAFASSPGQPKDPDDPFPMDKSMNKSTKTEETSFDNDAWK
jgi:hypothetical protein